LLCKKIAEACGGTVTAGEATGGGALSYGQITVCRKGRGILTGRILIAEDDAIFRGLLTAILRMPHEVTQACNGAEA
jgi:hypothetical protein